MNYSLNFGWFIQVSMFLSINRQLWYIRIPLKLLNYAISTQLSQMQIRFKRNKNRVTKKKKKKRRRKLVSILIQLGNTHIISSGTFQTTNKKWRGVPDGKTRVGKIGKTWVGLSAIFSRGSSRYANVSEPGGGVGEADSMDRRWSAPLKSMNYETTH